jgi:hypothetical protein
MDKPQCENCGKPFLPTWTGRPSRFCCRACSDAWFAEERRQAVVFFRQQGMKVRTTQASEPEEERRAAQA